RSFWFPIPTPQSSPLTHMKYDDPKYTAYALNELDGAERIALEAELQADPQAKNAIAEIRAAAEKISAALASEPLNLPLPLREGRGEGAENQPNPSVATPAQKPIRQSRKLAKILALAASLLLALGIGWLMRGWTNDNKQLAQSTSTGDSALNQNSFPVHDAI